MASTTRPPTCDGLVDGRQEGSVIRTDGWSAAVIVAGDALRFHDLEELRTVVRGDVPEMGTRAATIEVEPPLPWVPDNCGIWVES